jgi:hypothetical protein
MEQNHPGTQQQEEEGGEEGPQNITAYRSRKLEEVKGDREF